MSASQDQPVSVGNLAALVSSGAMGGGVVLFDGEPSSIVTLGQSVEEFTEVAVHVEGGPSNQRLLGTAHIINPQADNRYKFPMGDTGNAAITASLLIESGTRLESERTGAVIVRVVGYK